MRKIKGVEKVSNILLNGEENEDHYQTNSQFLADGAVSEAR